jgi:hypothetical protein
VGFPIAEIAVDGSCIVSKASHSGGLVDERTVKEQLLYELHDPAAYLTPDVVADITQATVAQVGPDRVRLAGVRGHPRTPTLKANVFFDGGWIGEGEISYAGRNAEARARLAMDIMAKRMGPKLPLRLRPDRRLEHPGRRPGRDAGRGRTRPRHRRAAACRWPGAGRRRGRPAAARAHRPVDRRPRWRRRRAHDQAPAPVHPLLPDRREQVPARFELTA